jgi:hypothetical protein
MGRSIFDPIIKVLAPFSYCLTLTYLLDHVILDTTGGYIQPYRCKWYLYFQFGKTKFCELITCGSAMRNSDYAFLQATQLLGALTLIVVYILDSFYVLLAIALKLQRS